ncbi:MAG: AAC(3) family N-acetyltransferase [Candidatus Diapherotrites archaeon]|nr:AAC(3) family N-acetyltransferase [Candidatus Diapherotrites archaeon]
MEEKTKLTQDIAAITPLPIKKIFRYFKGLPRRMRIYYGAYLLGNRISKRDIVEALRKLGVKEGSAIAVHSSLSRLGFVEGGAQAAIDALLEAVGKEGTIMMPAFSGFTQSKANLVFDVRSTESKTGIITETFRRMKGVKRSLHPISSVCAYGKKAEFIAGGHEKHIRFFEENTPFHKLMQLNGDIVLLGADIDTASFFHVVEDCVKGFPIKVYEKKPRILKAIDENGKLHNIKTYAHDLDVHEHCIDDNPAVIKRMRALLEKAGVLKTIPLGKGSASIMNSQKLMREMRKLTKKGITIYANEEEQGHKHEK